MHSTPVRSGQRIAPLNQRCARLAASTLTAVAALCATQLQASYTYNETSGDLSNVPSAPTALSFGLGDNFVYGTTGRNPLNNQVDQDFFTFTVPSGRHLIAVELLPGTTFAGTRSLSFIGAVSGGSFGATIPTSASSLLGWHHYAVGEIGTDILDDIGAGAGAQGFTPPLGAGTYSFWVQETATTPVSYGFDFKITNSSVPDQGPGVLGSLGAFGLLIAFRSIPGRKRARA